MTIPITKLHAHRLLEQVLTNLTGLQRDIANNAQAHKAMAEAKSPALATLQEFVNDAAAAYLTRLKWIEDALSASERREALVAALARIGCEESDVTDVHQALSAAVQAFQSAKKTDYRGIVAACDRVIAEVNKPESLWPE
jgi:hypothetical protein